MIALVEGANRQKTPNEIALNILLAGLTIIFLLAVVTLQPFAIYSGADAVDHRAGRPARLPHPDHDRRPAVGHRHRRHGPAGAAQRAGHVAAGPSRRPATCRRCCSTRPAPSPSATAWPPSSSRVRGVTEARPGRGGARSRRWPTRRPRAARSSSWPRSATASTPSTIPAPSSSRSPPRPACRASTCRRRSRSARARPTRCAAGSRTGRHRSADDLPPIVERHRRDGRHAAVVADGSDGASPRRRST